MPAVRVEPFRHFVDLHLDTQGGVPPARLFVKTAEEVSGWNFAETRSGELIGTVPAHIWARARSLALEWESMPISHRVPLSLRPLSAGPGRVSQLEECGAKLRLLPDALFSSTPVACAGPGPAQGDAGGLEWVVGPTRLLPAGLPLARKAPLTYPRPSPDLRPQQLGIYRFDTFRGKWIYHGGEVMEDGVVVGLTLNIRDITEEKDAEEKLINALAEAQKQRTTQEHLFNAAHAVLTDLDFTKNSKEIFEICKKMIGARGEMIYRCYINHHQDSFMMLIDKRNIYLKIT